MKKTSILLIALFASLFSISQNKTFFDFKAKTIDGDTISMADFSGKKILVVNTASKCGFTPQYKQLEEVYEKYKNNNFIIIGFPANNFMKQEPGTNEEIKAFCQKNYGVNFMMMSKISVKGKDMNPIYKWLTQKSENGVLDAPVTWNFQKFLIDENGHLVDFAEPKVKPDSPKIINWIESK